MSLLSTSSTTQQEAYLYENHYPQPIVVAPNSQICLQKFIHYRGSLYEVTTQNNSIGFRFGTGGRNQDIPRFVTIPVGTYDGSDLADAIALALNSANQQQNYEWAVTFTPAPSANDDDAFQISYISVPTPPINSGTYNEFSSGQLTKSNENQGGDEFAKITYNGTNADHYANVISKRSTLVYLGEQTWRNIAPNKNTEMFQPLQMGLVRNLLSNPANSNPNLQFDGTNYDIALELQGDGMAVTYGRQRQGSIVGSPNWFQSDIRRDLQPLFNAIFKPGNTFDPHMRLECKLTIYASAQTSRRVLIQLSTKTSGQADYTPLANGFGGNSPITNTPLVKTLNIGGDSFTGLVFDSNDINLNDTLTKINQHYPKLSVAPFLPTISFQKAGNNILTGYALNSDTWTNNAGAVITTFTALTNNANGYDWRSNTNVANVLDNMYWKQTSAKTFEMMNGDVPLLDPPLYAAGLDPAAGQTNPNGQLTITDVATNSVVQVTNFDGAAPVAEVTGKLSVLTQGIFNTIEPVASVQGSAEEVTAGEEGGGQLTDLSSNARLFLRGVGGGVEADVGNLLGFSNNEEDFGGGAATGAAVNSDQEPQQTANNNTLHISIPEMPLVKSYEGENSAEAKSIAIIPREEFATGETEGSLVYVAPFENWIDINNGQELNMNLLTTIVRNADGSLSENLVRETQAIFKLRQDPMKMEEEKKAERFKEIAEMMANTINTGLTSLISPQQLIGS